MNVLKHVDAKLIKHAALPYSYPAHWLAHNGLIQPETNTTVKSMSVNKCISSQATYSHISQPLHGATVSLNRLVHRPVCTYFMLMCCVLHCLCCHSYQYPSSRPILVRLCVVTLGRMGPYQQGKQEPVKSPLSSETQGGWWWLCPRRLPRHKCVWRIFSSLL